MADVEVTDTTPGVVGGVSATRFVTFGGATVATVTSGGMSPVWGLLLGDGQGSAQVSMSLTLGGSVTGVVGASATDVVSRNAYEPFGSVRGSDNLEVSRGWLGQVDDADTGLVYLNARYYDPVLARFISPDPLMNPGDPKTLDPYRYADNNPVMMTDATGLFTRTAPLIDGVASGKKTVTRIERKAKAVELVQEQPGYVPSAPGSSGGKTQQGASQPAPHGILPGVSDDLAEADVFTDNQLDAMASMSPESQDRYARMWISLSLVRAQYLSEYPDKQGLIDAAINAAAMNYLSSDEFNDPLEDLMWAYHYGEWSEDYSLATYQAPGQGLRYAVEAAKTTWDAASSAVSIGGGFARGVITVETLVDVRSLEELVPALTSGDLGKVDDFVFEFQYDEVN